ncbi:MAG: ZIP family metal transporter [Bacilli bacterium]|nr:ZIP family metal transporter [Bacilli bacterium]
MNKVYSLLLTLLAGVFFLIGNVITKKNKKKESLLVFSNSLALIVLVGLVLFDFIPELYEIFEDSSKLDSILTVISFIAIGFILLKLLDRFIPDHHHEHKKNESNHKEHESHVAHVGLVTAASLILHNIIEGMALTGTAINNLKAGLIMCIGVGLHNIPLGIEISLSTEGRLNKKTNIILNICLLISALIGGVIFTLLGEMNEFILGCIISVTLGMILYIVLCELLHEFINYKNRKEAKLGIIIGIIIIGLSLLI